MQSLKYLRSTTLDCINNVIKKSEIVAKTQFLRVLFLMNKPFLPHNPTKRKSFCFFKDFKFQTEHLINFRHAKLQNNLTQEIQTSEKSNSRNTNFRII